MHFFIEKDPRRTVELTDNDSLRPINNECSPFRYDGQFAQVNILLDNIFNFFFFTLSLTGYQPHGYLQR